MKTRKDIVEYILKLENEFPVNSWTYNGIYLWPNLKIRLYLELIRQVESDNSPKLPTASEHKVIGKPVSFTAIFYKFFALINYLFWFITLKKRNYLFVGSGSHRVDLNGKKYNRFFDTLIELRQLKDKYWFLEYDDTIQDNLKNEENVIFLEKWFLKYLGYQRIKKIFTNKKDEQVFLLHGYQSFINKLNDNPLLERYCLNFSEERLKKNYAVNWNNYYEFYKALLSKIKPSKILVLCYYDLSVMPLIAAANKMGILVVEMQHGPQADLHLAYGSWNKIPKDGYQVMPRLFLCWDNQSKEVIDKWAAPHSNYKAIVAGHPWVDYWKNKSEKYNNSGYILYSLQPSPLSINQLFPSSVIEFIKKEKYVWFLRLHPRQLEEKKRIEDFLLNNEILHLININNATNDPLPQLLSNCLLHITHFSGSAIEANLFKKYTVFLNQLAIDYFPNLIFNNEASFIDPSISSFKSKLTEIIEEHKKLSVL